MLTDSDTMAWSPIPLFTNIEISRFNTASSTKMSLINNLYVFLPIALIFPREIYIPLLHKKGKYAVLDAT